MNLIAELEAEQIAQLGKTIPDFKAGDTVLALGTGGVSIAALQIAKAMGAAVIVFVWLLLLIRTVSAAAEGLPEDGAGAAAAGPPQEGPAVTAGPEDEQPGVSP